MRDCWAYRVLHPKAFQNTIRANELSCLYRLALVITRSEGMYPVADFWREFEEPE